MAEQFSLLDLPELRPRYNICPGQPILAVRPAYQCNDPTRREAVMLRWGLVPHWADDPAIGNRLINARAETALQRPAFRGALRYRRCLIPADGFFEWQKQNGKKQPYFIRLKNDQLFAFAGLWESWEGPDHSYLESCTILTTEPNELVAPIHDRMPAIVPPEQYDRWLSPQAADPRRLLELCKPFPAELMEAVPVSTRVNNPRNDDPECIRPLPL